MTRDNRGRGLRLSLLARACRLEEIRVSQAALLVLAAILMALNLTALNDAYAADQQSTQLLYRALEVQGGEEKLRALHSVQWEASGYRNELERPEGPYVTEFDSISETHDFSGQRYRSLLNGQVFPIFKYRTKPSWRMAWPCTV